MRGKDCDRASYRGCSKTYPSQAEAAACRAFFVTAIPIIESDAITRAQPIYPGGRRAVSSCHANQQGNSDPTGRVGIRTIRPVSKLWSEHLPGRRCSGLHSSFAALQTEAVIGCNTEPNTRLRTPEIRSVQGTDGGDEINDVSKDRNLHKCRSAHRCHSGTEH
jgi:hypothetical protein